MWGQLTLDLDFDKLEQNTKKGNNEHRTDDIHWLVLC